MALALTISGIAAIIAGLLVLIWPKSLNIAVGLWLLLTGILNILP